MFTKNSAKKGLTAIIFLSTNSAEIIDPAAIILSKAPANERRRYNVTSSLIDSAYTQNEHWIGKKNNTSGNTYLKLKRIHGA